MNWKPLLLVMLVAKLGFAQQFNTALCWKLIAPETGVESYLYGTIHVSDERVYSFTYRLSSLIENCEVFALELNPQELNLNAGFQMFKSNESLKSLLPQSDYQILDSLCRAKLGFSADIIQYIKPIFVAVLLTEDELLGGKQEFLDLHLANIAQAKEKELIGLEELTEQLAAIDQIPLSYQVEMLSESLRDEQSNSALVPDMETLISAYVNGDTVALMESFSDEDLPEEFEQAMLTQRNQQMAERFHEIAKERSLFAAVGAAHLYGSTGLLQLLKQKGYQLENVALEKGP